MTVTLSWLVSIPGLFHQDQNRDFSPKIVVYTKPTRSNKTLLLKCVVGLTSIVYMTVLIKPSRQQSSTIVVNPWCHVYERLNYSYQLLSDLMIWREEAIWFEMKENQAYPGPFHLDLLLYASHHQRLVDRQIYSGRSYNVYTLQQPALCHHLDLALVSLKVWLLSYCRENVWNSWVRALL